MLLHENDPPDGETTKDQIPIFLRGPCVQECGGVKEKDTIIVLGAKLDICPSERKAFQIIADSTKGNLKVWLIQAPDTVMTGQKTQLVNKISNKNVQVSSEPPAKKPKLVLQPRSMESYTKLADLKGKTMVNVYAVVKFFKSPYKSRGSDFCSNVSLVDPTIGSLDHSFNCKLFAKTKESLLRIRSIGNIVRLHHIGVSEFNGELQGVGKVHAGFSMYVR